MGCSWGQGGGGGCKYSYWTNLCPRFCCCKNRKNIKNGEYERKYHNHKMQTNLWHSKEHNNHETSGRQIKHHHRETIKRHQEVKQSIITVKQSQDTRKTNKASSQRNNPKTPMTQKIIIKEKQPRDTRETNKASSQRNNQDTPGRQTKHHHNEKIQRHLGDK